MDVDNLKRIGDDVTVDAQETLATFMVGSVPNAGAFHHHMGSLIQQVLRNREKTTLRLYGEMVDVLWKRRREAEAEEIKRQHSHLVNDTGEQTPIVHG